MKRAVVLAGVLAAGLFASAEAPRGISEGTRVPNEMQMGVTFGFYAPQGYFGSLQARDEVEAMARAGVTWVTVVPMVWQEASDASLQYKDFERSQNDLDLADIIAFIHAKGMKVQLRPMLECKDGDGRLGVLIPDDRTRMGIARSRRSAWFRSMAARSAYYARIAERTKCEVYCLDSEFDRMIDENEKWKAVVAAVRQVYSGPVTSCHTVHCNVIDYRKVLADRNHWFYDLDFLSLSNYIPARRREDGNKALTVEEMMRNMEPARETMREIARLYGKPLTFGECGCTSAKGKARSPSWYGVAPADEAEQATYMEALFRMFASEPWCRGFHWWSWDVLWPIIPDTRALRRMDFTIRGKKAEGVFRAWSEKLTGVKPPPLEPRRPGPLPKDFTPLAWILSSTGYEFIDTRVVQAPGDTLVVTFEMPAEQISSWTAVFGGVDDKGHQWQFSTNSGVGCEGRPVYYCGGTYVAGEEGAFPTDRKVTLTCRNGEAAWTGGRLMGAGPDCGAGFGSIFLFEVNKTDVMCGVRPSNVPTRMKLYGFTLTDAAGKVKCDLIPCRTAQGEVGLWDRAVGMFLGNASGRGRFVGPTL